MTTGPLDKDQQDELRKLKGAEKVDFAKLAGLVKIHRTTHRLNLREAATQCGVSASTLSRIERGTARPDLDTVQSLVAWLEVPLVSVMSSHKALERSEDKKEKGASEKGLQNIKRLECQLEISFSKRPSSLGQGRVAPAESWVALWMMGPELLRFRAFAPTLEELLAEVDLICGKQR